MPIYLKDKVLIRKKHRGGSRGRVQEVPTPPWDDLRLSNTTGILQKKCCLLVLVMPFLSGAPPPKKNSGSAPETNPKNPNPKKVPRCWTWLEIVFTHWRYQYSKTTQSFHFTSCHTASAQHPKWNTAKAPTADLLMLNNLRGTNNYFLPLKRYKHPRAFCMGVPPGLSPKMKLSLIRISN